MTGLRLQINCRGSGNFLLSVDCELPRRGVTAVYGASGSGESTLLDCIAGLREAAPDSLIQLGNETWQGPGFNTPPWQRHIGYVFQDARLFPHLDVAQNLRYAMERQAGRAATSLDKVITWLQLTDLLTCSPRELSAGQKQRVAIGRALLSAPQLLLLDEPLANLDYTARQHCLACLQHLVQELDFPVLYVSHDIEEVSQLADHLLLLNRGQVSEQGPLLDLCSRLDNLLAREEQSAAIVTATVARHDEKYGLTELNLEGQPLLVNHLAQQPGCVRRVRIPARDVSICRERPRDSSILNILPVNINEIEDTDESRLLLRLSLGSQHLLARITRKSATDLALQPGDSLFAQIKSAALLMESVDHV